MRFSGQNVVITGGASGIGLATALAFHAEGASVAVFDLQTAPVPLLSLTCDVSSEPSVSAAAAEAHARFDGPVHVLINAAGIAVRHRVEDESVADWDRCFGVNVRGCFLASKYLLPLMISNSSIVNVASVTGIVGVRNRAAYSSTKGAIVALTRNMALDYASAGIRVNCVCPGFVKTPLIAALLQDPVRTAALTNLHPLGRLGEAGDVAEAILFLSSNAASWITGQSLAVDGGFSVGCSVDI